MFYLLIKSMLIKKMLINKIKFDVNNWVNIVIKHIINNNKRELNLKKE